VIEILRGDAYLLISKLEGLDEVGCRPATPNDAPAISAIVAWRAELFASVVALGHGRCYPPTVLQAFEAAGERPSRSRAQDMAEEAWRRWCELAAVTRLKEKRHVAWSRPRLACHHGTGASMLILLIKNDPVVAQSRSGGSPGRGSTRSPKSSPVDDYRYDGPPGVRLAGWDLSRECMRGFRPALL